MNQGPKLLARKVKAGHESTRKNLESELIFLKQNVENALRSLAEGGPLDEHLIQNATGITHHIVHYNLARDILPYLEEEDPK